MKFLRNRILPLLTLLAFAGAAFSGLVNISGSRGPSSSSSGAGRLVGDEIATMTNGVSDGPNYGFDGYSGEAGCEDDTTITRVASGGPGNRPYFHYEIVTALSEFGCGWVVESPYGNPASPTITRGESIFFRYSYMPLGDYDQTQKIVVQTPGTSATRSVNTIREYDEGFRIGMGLNGGDIPFAPTMTGLGTWRNVQVELRFSSVEGVEDGYQKVWVDNDTYGSPTYDSGPMEVSWRDAGVGDEYVSFSGYHQSGVTPGREFGVADFRLGPTFYATWHASGS